MLVGALCAVVVIAFTWVLWPAEAEINARWEIARTDAAEAQEPNFGNTIMSRAQAEKILAEQRVRTERGEEPDFEDRLRETRARRRLGRSVAVPSTSRAKQPAETVRVWVSFDTEERMMAEARRREREISEQRDAVDERFSREIQQLPARRAKFLAGAAAWWVIPMASLYVFGWLVGWVIRGFRAS
jgi:hypothetical protein